ncbi:MAG: 16S rRNA (cytosine(1402)-N(4))-methyltransferase RsmH [Thermotogae bacterium]|nr:16S rRNA (cytosine(1402)-N(4))-methyltransferase RsmH [Thermotogota bacterium]
MKIYHKSIMVDKVIDLLNVQPSKTFVDCTLGEGGHSFEILKTCKDKCRVIGIDADSEIMKIAKERLKEFSNFVAVNCRFSSLDSALKQLNIEKVDGFLFDLGISSYHLDNPHRGFSFRFDTPLDMRMNRNEELTAEYVVNYYSKRDLERVLRDYGEEPFAKRIANSIIKNRPIKTTKELVAAISKVYPRKYKNSRIHFATRVFMAIRIEVNRELQELRTALTKSLDFLNVGGRIVVITFHSLEDRIVKRFFKENEGKGLKILTKKPLYPTEEELIENPRARSAKLRAAEKE